ncbi:MAG: peptidoglycan D,D-transpeptidase FtsI family protein [Candidatus Dojkabacteria bacterium]
MDQSLKENAKYLKLSFVVLFAVLIAQLFRVQVLENDKWSIRSAIRNELRMTYAASRGNVFFHDGSPLAVNELAYGIFVLPEVFKDDDLIQDGITFASFAHAAADILGVDRENLYSQIADPGKKYVPIAKKVSVGTMNTLMEAYPLDLHIWTYEEQMKRIYPDGQLASKLIGFVGKDEEGNEAGRYGIEKAFDGVLRGTEGLFEGQKDSNNHVIVSENFENVNSRNGIDITLTIDRGIQMMLEEKLMYWLDKLKAKEATAVILEPGTGRLIASANVPQYDPNQYWKGEVVDCELEYYVIHTDCNEEEEEEKDPELTEDITDIENQDELDANYPDGYVEEMQKQEEEKKRQEEEEEEEEKDKVDERIAKYNPLIRENFREEDMPLSEVHRNAANSFLYEPGSVIKVLTLAIAYHYNAVPRDPHFPLGGHSGCAKITDRVLCTSDKRPKSSLNVVEMLQYSDNIGAIRVAQTVPIEKYVDALNQFGVGRPTEIELADETVFSMKNKLFWTKIDQATASYGQGSVAFTPIQLAHAWNILASDGKAYKPYLVQKINDNGVESSFDPTYLGQVVNEEAAKDALHVNALASRDSFLTEARDFHQKYPFTAKTGTANIPKPDAAGYLEDVVNTSYLGSAPLDTPKFTMLVWFREPRIGSDGKPVTSLNTAQIAWIDIAEELMVRMQVPPRK